MPRKQFIGVFATLSFLIGFFHYVIIRLQLEYYFSWIDLIPHALGGAWIIFFAYFFSRYFLRSVFTLRAFRLVALFAFVSVAVSWEFFEVWYGVALKHLPGYWFDTVLDLVVDSCGALIAYTRLARYHREKA